MSAPLYLLDTNILLLLIRGKAAGLAIDARFNLRDTKTRSLISVVTHGELRVLARRRSWGDKKSTAMEHMLDALVTVDIHHPDVFGAYVAVEAVSQQHPAGAKNMGQNDLWIAACASAAGATLLTIDTDFNDLPRDLVAVEYIDEKSLPR